jgi:hypothetical protein
MKSSGKPSRRKRAVGSIIGAVFLVLIILSGFTFYQLYLNIAGHYNGTLQSMGESDWSRNREKIVIKNVEITGSGNLSVTVENDGTLQSHLIWFGIFNMSALPETQAYYSLDISVDPAETKSVVSVFTVAQGNKYAVQLVTELGNTIGFKFYPASQVRCQLTLTTAPPTAYKGNNVTVVLTVTHNDSEVDAIQSLTVSLSPTPSGLVQLMDNSSLTARGLRKGESAFFWWIYSTIGTGTVILNATYGQAPPGVYAITSLTVLDSPGQGGAGTVSIAGVNGTGLYNPSTWNPLGSTQYVSGSVSDLASNDSSYAVFRSYYSSSTTDTNDAVDNNSSNVDGLGNKGTHSNFTAMQYGPDSIYDTLTETGSGTATAYYPSSYSLLGSTQLVSGSLANLQADDGVYMAFRSYQTSSSGQLLYAHSETTTIGGTNYRLLKRNSADAAGLTLSADAGTTTGRKLMDKFVYQLTGVSSIPASTWTIYYQAYKGHVNVEAHGDVDILVRMSNGTTRSTIATNAANSGALTTSPSTLSGTYSWAAYTVIDQTDYLEIDYYIEVTQIKAGYLVYLRIDDNTLLITDQTRATNVMLPGEYTVEVEFSGTSDTSSWTQLVWTIDSSFSVAGVTATFQLYNYTAGAYPTSGNGYMTDTIGTSNVTKTQTITVNPNHFRDGSGNWRMKVKGVLSTITQFDWRVDSMKFAPSTLTYELDLEVQWTGVDYSQTNEWLCVYGGTMGAESLRVDVWNGSTWNNVFASLSSGWNNVSVSSYLTSSNFTIRFKGTTETGDIIQDSWNVDVAFLHLWTSSDQYTAEVEFTGSSNLQIWTRLLWQIQSCWDVGQVAVTIQFYNFTLGNYSTSGNGYLGYVSNATPNTNELKSQAEISSPGDFKNATGHWRVRIKGVKLTSTQFLFKVDWVDFETTYSTTGSTVPYNVWQWYTIRATSASGGPIPYAYVSIYANGTLVRFRNVTDKVDIGNPAWVRLDAGGQFMLEVRSAYGPGETFVLYAVVGSAVGQKTVTQEAP